jgi:hypothetical protein
MRLYKVSVYAPPEQTDPGTQDPTNPVLIESVVAWAGTLADARNAVKCSSDPSVKFVEYDVPTNKPDLLVFLNTYALGTPAPTPTE